MFISVFTRALHWSLSRAISIQPIPSHPISLRFISILSTHLRLVFLVVSFLLAFPPISSSSHSCYVPCPSHPPWLDHSNYVWRGVEAPHYVVSSNLPSLHLSSVQTFSSAPSSVSAICNILSLIHLDDDEGHWLGHVNTAMYFRVP
jgi:hypothetical protein